MTAVSVGELLAAGLAAHQASRLDEAEHRYREALASQPALPDALHLLAVAALQRGRVEEARDLAARATDVAPADAALWNTRGVAERQAGQAAQAARSFRRAVDLDPAYVEGWANLAAGCEALGDANGEEQALTQLTSLQPGHARGWGRRGVLAYRAGRLHSARDYFAEAVRLAPGDLEAWTNLGVTQLLLGQLEAAEASQRRAVALDPGSLVARNNLGNVLVARSRWAEAAAVLTPVVEQAPHDANGWVNLGHALKGLERHQEARAAYERALRLRPGDPAALVGLGDALQGLGDLHGALGCYGQALARLPDDPDTHEHLGVVLQRLGRVDAAAAAFRSALALDPDRPATHSFLIVVLDLKEGGEDEAVEERRRWNARFGRRRAGEGVPHANRPDPGRRLRVGYVSADFRHHSAAYSVLPVLRAHDRQQVQVVCYSGVTRPDHVTTQVRAVADLWRDVADLTDDALVAQVRADEIDVLVDLSGHSGGNRLPVFAWKPAPVQVTAWGYATGTGLDAMDYFLADPVLVPPEAWDSYAEEVADLPCFLCYEPPAAPEIAPLPAARRGYVTFGAFNRLPKLSAEALAAWGRVLAAVPSARLVIKCGGADTPPERERLLGQLATYGVHPDRVTVLGSTPQPDHLAAHAEIDLMLDSLPQSGGITTLDALLMGVPVVTLLGARPPGRASAALLAPLGLGDLVARTTDQYVQIAARLAGDVERLAHERGTLRQRLLTSPIADADQYTRAVETTYRAIWRRWCDEQGTRGKGRGTKDER